MHPNKGLGQYFLINKEKIKGIIDSLELKRGDFVIEIGAGRGELTQELVARNQTLNIKIITIEKDKGLIEHLKKSFENEKGLEIINSDALKILPKLPITYNLSPTNFKLVGNIPYYITGRLLRVISELESKPGLIVLTLQKEVAERLCAHPSRRRQDYGGQAKIHPAHKKCSMCGMNLLAASIQFWANPEIIDYIPKKDFKPQPKVNSAIIRLRTKDYAVPTGRQESETTEKYYKLIKILFKQPRKTILNNLVHGLSLNKTELIEKLGEMHISPSDRPQCLSTSEIQKLSQHLIS